jgi:hypothetical protein
MTFGTYPEGMTPPDVGFNDAETGLSDGQTNWYQKMDDLEEATGVPYLGILAGILLVAFFTLMPFIATSGFQTRKTDQSGSYMLFEKSVPIPVTLSFTLMGCLLAFGMGLFPIWVFIPPAIIIMLSYLYKVVTWVKSRRVEEAQEMIKE